VVGSKVCINIKFCDFNAVAAEAKVGERDKDVSLGLSAAVCDPEVRGIGITKASRVEFLVFASTPIFEV
jgi:hypothetical protein